MITLRTPEDILRIEQGFSNYKQQLSELSSPEQAAKDLVGLAEIDRIADYIRKRDEAILSLSASQLQDFYKATFPGKKLVSHTGCRFV